MKNLAHISELLFVTTEAADEHVQRGESKMTSRVRILRDRTVR